MSIRKLTTNEIQAVGTIFKDKEAIEILKKIRDNVITEADTKGKRKGNELFSFVGFAHQDDILGGGEDADPESEEYKQKAGSIKILVDAGLILEGFHVPLERGSEKKYGDVHVPSQERIAKYKITEEGLTLLSVLGVKQQQQEEAKVKSANGNGGSSTSSSKKAKAVEEFKKEVKEENKL